MPALLPLARRLPASALLPLARRLPASALLPLARLSASALLPLAALALPTAVHAGPAFTSDMFEVTHSVPSLDGDSARAMTEFDRNHFINRARCECGQPLRSEIRLRPDAPKLDNTTLLSTYVGNNCATAESDPLGQFRRCGVLKAGVAPDYAAGVSRDHHPIYLASGIDLSSKGVHGIGSPDTILAGDCTGTQGGAGIWTCAQTNPAAGCQADEFFLQPTQTPQPPEVKWDFLPPISLPTDFTATVADGGVQLDWHSPVGDINGFRVLCERSDGELAPDQSFDTPDILAEADGTHYFTKHNVCGDDPFLTFTTTATPTGDGSCGDGHQDPGEACDDGSDNNDEGLCRTDCTLAVSAGLHALDWDYLCSDHLAYNEKSVNIYGLENGVEYRFVLVAHDASGNPRAVPLVVHATPDAALDPLPGAPEEGCACRSDPTSAWPTLLLLPLLGLMRRRRRPA